MANFFGNSGAGVPIPQSRLEGNDVVRLRGRILLSGAINTPNPCATLVAGHRPAQQATIQVRIAGPGTATLLTVDTNGNLSAGVNLASTNQVVLDGLTFSL